MGLVEIQSKQQFTDLTSEKDKLIALYFHTPWASPCIQMNKVISTLADSPQNKEIGFLAINADNFAEIADLFDISAVPYIVLVRNGTILKELSGADPKEFATALEKFSTGSGANAAENVSQQPSQQAQSSQSDANKLAELQAQEQETPEQLNARLKKLTTAAPIMLFMKGTPSAPQCGFSRQMVAILREHQVRFGFFDILKDETVRQGLKKFSDWPTFPQLYINGEFQGGLDIIKENLSEDGNFFENAFDKGKSATAAAN